MLLPSGPCLHKRHGCENRLIVCLLRGGDFFSFPLNIYTGCDFRFLFHFHQNTAPGHVSSLMPTHLSLSVSTYSLCTCFLFHNPLLTLPPCVGRRTRRRILFSSTHSMLMQTSAAQTSALFLCFRMSASYRSSSSSLTFLSAEGLSVSLSPFSSLYCTVLYLRRKRGKKWSKREKTTSRSIEI